MKKITLTLAAFATALTMNAQTTIFSDDFNDEDVSDWELYDEDGDGNNWADLFQISNQAGEPVTPVSIISRSWQGSPLTPDNWIVSPAIDLSAEDGSDEIMVSWMRQVSAAFPEETYTLYVGTSDDIADLENATVTLTESFDAPSPETDTPQEVSLNITELAGEVVYLAFRHYNSEDADFISIDDVTVTSGAMSVENEKFANFTHFVDASNNLNLSAKTPMSQVTLFSILGQQVMSKKLSAKDAQINLSSLNAGVYLAQVSIEGEMKSFKIIKK